MASQEGRVTRTERSTVWPAVVSLSCSSVLPSPLLLLKKGSLRCVEFPKRQQPNANPQGGALPPTPTSSLTSQPQGGPDDSNPPAEPVETPPELVEGEGPKVMVVQPPAGEDSIQTDVTRENEPDMTNETDDKKNPVEVRQDAEPNHTQISDKETGRETVTGGDTNDSTQRSERSRQPPDRFHYIQSGKPLMSFAQSILPSFNQALDTMSNYDSPQINQRSAHEEGSV